MELTQDEVRHVAALARLALSDEEAEHFSRQLSQILTYVQTLNELDTSQVEPTAHAVPMANVWREDVVAPSCDREAILADAPDRTGEFFRVPKILAEGGQGE
ncbi:MAG: Asp-tRNA(Asn)/Glu-tRNA(Gln) amidotransferase subunit GatC [Nitrospirota bacterium]